MTAWRLFAVPGSRRLAAAAITAAVLSAGLLAPAASRRAPARAGGLPRPNVLIILTDDQRLDTLEVMPAVRKWFGAGGTTYRNAYVSTPLCCPSRATIMTGRYAHNHGVVDNKSHFNLNQQTTIQRYLRASRYRTGIVGKYFNGWASRQDPPYFDRWAIFRSGYHNMRFNVDGKVETIRRYSTDYIARQTVSILKSFERKDARPWLMMVGTAAPHEPFTPAARHTYAPVSSWDPPPSVGEEDRSDKPPAVQRANGDEEAGAALRQAQLRTLMAVDEMVARIMQTLGDLREQERTLAFFVSDNGYFWAEHGLSDKRMPYTEAVQVPLLARWPGRLAPGATDSRLVSLVDVAPTIMAAAGLPQDLFIPMDGRSLFDAWDRERLLIEYFPDAASSIGPWASIRTTDEQYVEYYDQLYGVTTEYREYYDLEEDPYQLLNLLGDTSPANDPSPAHVQQLSLQLAEDRTCQGTTGPNPCP